MSDELDQISSVSSTRSSTLLLCDQCYDAFDMGNGADICKHCHLVYCQACIEAGAFIDRPTQCVNCHTGKLSIFDYISVAKYLIRELHLNGRKLIEDIRRLEEDSDA